MDILIYAAIAAFLGFRLWSVLGQKGEDDPKAPRKPNPFGPSDTQDEENVLVLEGRARPAQPSALTAAGHAPTSLAGALDQIKAMDATFEEKKFLEGAKTAFAKIVGAFAAGDLSPVAWLLGPEVRQPFAAAIQSRTEKGQTLENKIERFLAADIIDAQQNETKATLAVEFVTHQVNLLKTQDGQIVDGTPGHAEEVRDVWVFERDLQSSNPNWKLVETRA